MKKRIQKRMLAWMLTFAMVLSMIPVTAFAEEDLQSTECTHSHDETCGYVEAVDEIPCDQECTDTDEDGLIDHVEECAYTPAVEGQPCTHVHDETCGGVIVEQPKKEIEEESMAEDTRTLAEDLLQTLLEQYFEGVDTGEIYQVILEMNTDTRLGMIDAYEELLAALTEEDEYNESLWELLGEIYCGISDAAENEQTQLPVFYQTNVMALERSDSIELKRISGSGNAFVYHSFQEITEFTAGKTYAFLDSLYGEEDAVSALGSGAILKVTTATNSSSKYIKRKYGDDAAVKVYVDVITRGRDFDSCIIGGLYEVPNSGTPTEYRYFCGYGGAQNCGPYYAYNYEVQSLTYENVSASLKDIEKQGSANPEDYTVMITYDENQCKTLDAGSYTVRIPDPASDQVIIVVSDSEGNSITAKFQCPLAVRYDGNAENVSNVPSVQAAWKGESSKISLQKPTRTGYLFVNWKDAETATAYSEGQSFTPAKSMNLLAQWKDNQAPNVGYTPTQVMTGDSDSAVKDAVQAALTVTDNEPVSECNVTVTLQSDFTKTPGNKDVTVKVTDKAGNTTTMTCSVYVSSYVDISTPVFTASTKKLISTLKNPGTDAVTESGFVWGVMNSPSLTVNNGKAKTATKASKAGDIISVTADNLQKGVKYYARAYITADGITYYSEEIEIGLGLPAYGSFTITNNNNHTFTVTRSGGSEGAQTVYFRTVNGSAVGGTHFTHKNDTLTFNAGVTSQTITITENTANTAYSGKPATAYSNADRTYSVEIYRVTGGGTLGDTTSATRTMENDNGYTVERSIYNEQVINGPQEQTTRGDYNDDKLGWTKDNSYQAAIETISIKDSLLSGIRNYWTNTAQNLYYQLSFTAWEGEPGYQAVQISPGESLDTSAYPYDNELQGSLSSAYYMALFEHNGTGQSSKKLMHSFPRSNNTKSLSCSGRVVENNYVRFDILQEKLSVGYGACGTGSDKWYTEEVKHHFLLNDTTEPQLVAVAPMADGLYKVGDSFTVSLIFDEIVDRKNSCNLSSVVVNTSWGTASYVGGADTNVLYFKGTIVSNASTTLSVNGITNASYIKDMCSASLTQTASGSGDTTATVDTSIPNFNVTANGITNGTGKATIKINADKAKTTGMSYVWSDSETAPISGWVELSSSELTNAKSSSGLSLSIRKEPGSGASNGKWYLHVKAVYDTTGASAYQNTCLDFGTAASPGAGSTPPTLTVSADNSNWATSRNISISAQGAEELKYRKSGSTLWTPISLPATSVSVQENGYYTFLLTAGDVAITKTVQVAKIDRENPTASVGNLTRDSVESPKSGVYTKLVLPITYADTQSGVETVQYQWTDSTTTPTSWITLQAGATTVTYTANTESQPTEKYLHLKVTDNVEYTATTYSSAYTVISQTAVDNHAPTITITGAPTGWINDMATLTWELADYSEKNYEVILPDGRKARTGAAKGEVWARRNGTYTVKVRDLDYGGENTASVVVDKLDFDPPTVTVSGGSDSWTNTNQTFKITADDNSQSGVDEKWCKIVSTTGEIPTEGLTKFTGNTITVSDDGEHYVYYKVYDKTGDTETDREANKTEGFTKLIKIDKTAPTIGELSYSYQPTNLWEWLIGKESLVITVPVTEEGSGVGEVTYTMTPEGGSAQNNTAQIQNGSAEITVSANFKGTISITCTDQAGNTSAGVTVGTSGKGLIIEDNAPEITFGTYTAASGITVTVKDAADNAISAGLASVTYQIGNGSVTTVQRDFTTNMVTEASFTITAADIPTGGVDIVVKATDNAGNDKQQSVRIAKYNVTYDGSTNGGGSTTKASDVILSGGAIDLTPTATKPGWTFVGWNTNQNATEGLTSLTMQGEDITLYAIYSKVLTLTCYSGRAGDTQTNTVTIYNKAAEGQLTVPAARAWGVPDESYTFYGYATSPNQFEGTVVNGNSTISLSEDTCLYAVYRKAITVSYDANGGSGSVNAQKVFQQANVSNTVAYKEASVVLRDGTGLSRIGYSFRGWIKGSGTGTAISAGTSVTLTADTTLYAKWTAATDTSYKVNHYTEDLTGGTWTLQGTDSKIGTTGAALALADLAESIPGFTYKEGKAGGSVVTSTTILADGSRVIDLYYTRNAYTLTLNKGTGISDVTGAGSYKYGQSVSANAAVSAGHTWKNWTGDQTSADQKFSFTMPASNVTLTANATINQYTVTFNANGHGTAPGSQTVNYGGKAVQPAALTETGYTFDGWYKEDACENKWDFTADKVTSNITLYAKWTASTYTVTYHLTNPDGTPYTPGEVNYTYGQGLNLSVPIQEGFAFSGWYDNASYTGTKYTAIGKTVTGDKEYYAYYQDVAKPSISVSANGYQTGENGWWRNNSSEQVKFNVTYSDNVSVTELWVKVDNGVFTQITTFAPSGLFSYTALQEGEHTYTFKAVDAAGNETETAAHTAKLDTGKPEIGTITFDYKAANIFDWIIGKDSLIIYIPVTDNTSGVKTLMYTETPSGGTAETKTITLSGTTGTQTANLKLDADWKGTITNITCTDAAGNVSDSKGIEGAGNGIIVEDNAPEITILADRGITDASSTSQSGTELSTEYYDSAPNLLVTVKDDAENAISAGLKSVTWKLGEGTVQNVGGEFQSSMKIQCSFTISDLQGRTGSLTLTVNTEDQAGNTASETVTVHIKGKEEKPNPSVDYVQEKLTDLIPNATYVIEGENLIEETITADDQGYVAIKEAWFGKDIQISKRGGTTTLDSDKANVSIASRTAAPSVTKTNETIKGKKDGTLTRVDTTMEYRVDGGSNWTSINESNITEGRITGLGPCTIQIREKATTSSPHGEVQTVTIAEGRTLTVTFVSNGGSSIASITGKSWEGTVTKPENPLKEGYNFEGWYRENTFETIWHFTSETGADKLTDDVTLYAKWTLNEPSVTLTADGGTTNPVTGVIQAVYNNGNTLIALTAEPSHAAVPEGSSSNITYTYQWYRDGQVLTDMDSTVRSLDLKDVNQSGTYTVKVTAKDEEGRTSEAGSSNEVIVNIAKAPITFTVSENTHSYDATAKTASVEQTAGESPRIDSTKYQVSYEQNGNKVDAPKDAGTYDVMVTLIDDNFSHFGQSDSVTKQKVGELIIKKKQVTSVWKNLTAEYNGTAQAPVCTTLVGLMKADAGQDDAGRKYVSADFTAEQRLTNAGTKRLTAALAGTRADNYQLTNAEINFTVQKAPVTFAVADHFVQADGHAHRATVSAYVNGKVFGTDKYTITYRTAAGQTVDEPTDAGNYGIYAKLTDANYRHSGTAEATARQIGVLTIYRNQTQTPKTYTVKYASGAEEASEVTGDLPAEQTGLSEGTLIYLPGKGTLSRTGYAFTGWLLNGKLYQPGETFTMPARNVTITACWKEATYRISGVVDQEGNPLYHAVVTLKRGSEIIGETTTDTEGEYRFEGVMPGLYNLITSYDGIITTVKVLIVDADAVQNATLPAGRTNSILDVMAGAPAVVVGNLEKLFRISEGSNSPAYPEIYTANDKNVVETGGTVEIRLTVEKVAEPDQTGADLLKEAMKKLPEAFNYQTELYLDLVLQKTVYSAAVGGSGSAVTETLSDSHVILESVISLPSNLQNRRFYKVYRIHQNAPGDIVLEELTEQPNTEGEYFELNPENTEMTIHARKYSVYTVAASDYVAPQPANPERSEETGEHFVTGLPEETIQLPEEEKKAKNSQINENPLDKETKLPEESDAETEKTEVIPEDIPKEEVPVEETITNETIGKPFVLLNVMLTLLSLAIAALMMMSRQEKKLKIAVAIVAVISLLILLLTLGFHGVRLADLRTILFAVLVAAQVILGLTGINREDKKEEV